ncbi:hypothetical protein KI809_18410 [Geobacter pelophilus]|uniref:Transposase n=1 Tax=Geoanaerobacter pelophilus TaxID=60036 RepID=A0AAW4L5N8_9BACT|nr:hypothetical protein [Geoanaerobacter pelophilus]MBT0666288.1 hypothetical protein [Geoanaerobacter pelophilus]
MIYRRVEEYTEWLQSYKWEAFLTVRLPPNLPLNAVAAQVIKYIYRPLCRYLRTRVAAISVISHGHGMHKPHVHVLLATANGQLTDNINEISDYLKSTITPLNSHKDAIDLRPYIPDRHAVYVASHVVDETDLTYYDKKQLTKLKDKTTCTTISA